MNDQTATTCGTRDDAGRQSHIDCINGTGNPAAIPGRGVPHVAGSEIASGEATARFDDGAAVG